VTQVLVGAISDQLGLASSWETVEARHTGRNFDVRRSFWACPSDRFLRVQPSDVPLEAGHGGPRLGTVEHLEQRSGGRLWVAASVDDGYDLTRQPWQLSYDLIEKRDGYELRAVAVVEKSATLCTGTIEVRDGTLASGAAPTVYQHGLPGELTKAAHETARRRKRDDPLVICTPPSILPEPQYESYDSYVRVSQGDGRKGRPVPPQARPGWRPGMLEWSNHRGQVLRVS
jgi:hypothetical protein